jgi:hypothetical protein
MIKFRDEEKNDVWRRCHLLLQECEARSYCGERTESEGFDHSNCLSKYDSKRSILHAHE